MACVGEFLVRFGIYLTPFYISGIWGVINSGGVRNPNGQIHKITKTLDFDILSKENHKFTKTLDFDILSELVVRDSLFYLIYSI